MQAKYPGITFDNFRLRGMDYIYQSGDYWEFKSLISNDQRKALIKADIADISEFKVSNNAIPSNEVTEYRWVIDRHHYALFKRWQVFLDDDNIFLLFDRNYFHVIESSRAITHYPDTHMEFTWQDVLAIAKLQEDEYYKNNEPIIVPRTQIS